MWCATASRWLNWRKTEKKKLCCAFLHRFGPYYTEPVIAGLDPITHEPFICSLDLIGCPMITDDFVVSGTCSEQMYGMCESLWEPDMVSEAAKVSSASWIQPPAVNWRTGAKQAGWKALSFDTSWRSSQERGCSLEQPAGKVLQHRGYFEVWAKSDDSTPSFYTNWNSFCSSGTRSPLRNDLAGHAERSGQRCCIWNGCNCTHNVSAALSPYRTGRIPQAAC